MEPGVKMVHGRLPSAVVPDTAQVRLLLLVTDPHLRDLCCRELAAVPAEVVVVSQIFPLSQELERQSFNGLLFEVKAKMREVRLHKTEIYKLTSRFPTAHLQLDGDRGKIRVFHPGQSMEKSLVKFVEEHCRLSAPQRIRAFPRKLRYIPVLLHVGDSGHRRRRSVTRDISPGGCFLITFQSLPFGQEIRLEFRGRENLGTILAEVRNVVPWGKDQNLPGVGVKFVALTDEQERALHLLCEDL